MKTFKHIIFGLALVISGTNAHAAIYTSNYGIQLPQESNCDDCFSGEHLFTGSQTQTFSFFGNIYAGLYISSNGYVTFGSGSSVYTPQSLDTQTIRPMIAGLFTDLDANSDVSSSVYINNSIAGQHIITWADMEHYPASSSSVRSTFQLVVRTDQFVVTNPGEGKIGFFYDNITDGAYASAGFGDGLNTINTGEVAFYNGVASGLNQSSPRWYGITSEGAPVETPQVPVPAGAWLMGSGLIGLAGISRQKRSL